MYVGVNVYLCEFGSCPSFKEVWLNNKDPFCLNNSYFPDKYFGLRLELVDEFMEIVPSASEPS